MIQDIADQVQRPAGLGKPRTHGATQSMNANVFKPGVLQHSPQQRAEATHVLTGFLPADDVRIVGRSRNALLARGLLVTDSAMNRGRALHAGCARYAQLAHQ